MSFYFSAGKARFLAIQIKAGFIEASAVILPVTAAKGFFFVILLRFLMDKPDKALLSAFRTRELSTRGVEFINIFSHKIVWGE